LVQRRLPPRATVSSGYHPDFSRAIKTKRWLKMVEYCGGAIKIKNSKPTSEAKPIEAKGREKSRS